MDIDRKMGTSMNTKQHSTAEHHAARRHWLNSQESGYHKAMGNRQVQMIAIGGAIGTGLFLGAGGRLHNAGPGLFLVYLICGGFVFLILRALGELVLHRPSSGSFVSYAREFLGEKAAYVAGWMYFLNWAMTSIVDSTAIATYFHYWKAFDAIPQWLIALIALAIKHISTNLKVRAWMAAEQRRRMMAQMVVDKAGDEVVAVVVAGMAVELQGVAGGPAGGFEGCGLELLGEEAVGLALVDPQGQALGGGGDELAGVPGAPGAA